MPDLSSPKNGRAEQVKLWAGPGTPGWAKACQHVDKNIIIALFFCYKKIIYPKGTKVIDTLYHLIFCYFLFLATLSH